ncbi:MAG: Arm DNA-binding domain-containing protein [Pseudomonadota bacterium]
MVKPNGSKLWQMRYWRAGREKTLSPDHYPVITLAKEREGRLEAKRLIADSGDPSADK